MQECAKCTFRKPHARSYTLRTMTTFAPPTNRDELEREIRDRDIQFLFAQFVDMHGKPNAKLVPAAHLDDLLTEGAGFAGFAAGAIGQMPNDPDMLAIPDIASFTPLPWKPEVEIGRASCRES